MGLKISFQLCLDTFQADCATSPSVIFCPSAKGLINFDHTLSSAKQKPELPNFLISHFHYSYINQYTLGRLHFKRGLAWSKIVQHERKILTRTQSKMALKIRDSKRGYIMLLIDLNLTLIVHKMDTNWIQKGPYDSANKNQPIFCI